MCEHCGWRYSSAEPAWAVYPMGGDPSDPRPLMYELGRVHLASLQDRLGDSVMWVAAAYHLLKAHPDEFAALFPDPIEVDAWPRPRKAR